MKHKHAELIHAWADGAEIESKVNGYWWGTNPPRWDLDYEYRIKPEEKKPVVRWLWAYRDGKWWQIDSLFMTDEDVQKFPNSFNYIKLEYTRTEFPE